jgi:dihydropteroate synthase
MNTHSKTINCGGKLIDLSTPCVMGILNTTPDSFFDGGKYGNEKQWLDQVGKMVADGAAMIDIGAVSTRPGAEDVSKEEELDRLIPAIKVIRREYSSLPISVDTWRAEVAIQSVDAGANIINDISGGLFDEKMFSAIARLNVPYVMMHTGGKPDIMQANPHYNHPVNDIIEFFATQLHKLRELGVHDIILDPGFGFGKTLDHNYQLLAKLSSFQLFDLPILVGVSRKSMIQKLLNTTASESLNGTSVVNTIALLNGASILRVHDVKEAVEAVEIVKKTNLFASERL